ncbi:hypothetical protein GCM10008090_16810 [Arenicella chitinivorans]|uniref:Metal-dependent hydrolase n=1 Tax=Arenicella chitinivorans TaxID=1329800 RepID=A0A918RP80_9GAMM|nr:metal-dependent hydrolase [Arenicella chitinivorans]GHA07624.1 hypothetical protein GCM10008090_16810 [Arenicella chitinivorans]
MDPLTQGVVGITASQLVAKRSQKMIAAGLGFCSGMAADLDVLIKSDTDPLLFLEYHRHFTHALVFIPVGALICALIFAGVFRHWRRRSELSFGAIYRFCFAGYATHAVLDACTTYGTQLFWPFSDARIAWNSVSVVDPLFTLPLLTIILVAVLRRSHHAALFAMVYALGYLGVGAVQEHRALDAARALAASRGHAPVQLGVKPSFGNLIVWKSVYRHGDSYYVDAVRVLAKPEVYVGVSAPRLDLNQHFPWLERESQQALDVARFAWFSNQHLGIDPQNPNRIIDIRYSLIPNQITGMWGITLDQNATTASHVAWSNSRPAGDAARQRLRELWQMIRGDGAQPLDSIIRNRTS